MEITQAQWRLIRPHIGQTTYACELAEQMLRLPEDEHIPTLELLHSINWQPCWFVIYASLRGIPDMETSAVDGEDPPSDVWARYMDLYELVWYKDDGGHWSVCHNCRSEE